MGIENLARRLVNDGQPNDFYGLDSVTAYAMGWHGLCSLGAGDLRGMNIMAAGPPQAAQLKAIVAWGELQEPLLARLVREGIVSPGCARLAINRFQAGERDYKLVNYECELKLEEAVAAAAAAGLAVVVKP